MPGPVRIGAAGFSIGSKGYIGTGYNNAAQQTLRDFWEWDPATNLWLQRADLAGPARGWATGSSTGSNGYIGLGSGGSLNNLSDFWTYDPTADAWTQRSSYGGLPAFSNVSLAIGSKIYVLGRGYDFWEFNPATNTWTQKSDYPGNGYTAQAGFVIGNMGYVGTGETPNATYSRDFWEYDPQTDNWTQKANFGGTGRTAAVGFAIGNRGYIGTGGNGPAVLFNDFWEYSPAADAWTRKANFGGTARYVATGFPIGNKGYIGTGWDQSGNRNDFWEYTPDSALSVETPIVKNAATVYPNPCSVSATIALDQPLNGATLTVYNAMGQQVQQLADVSGKTLTFQRGNLPAGNYFICLMQNGALATPVQNIRIADN